MNKSLGLRNFKALVLIVAGLSILAVSCSVNKYDLRGKDTEALKDLWLNSPSQSIRNQVVQEMENRKAIDALSFCLHFAVYYYKTNERNWGKYPLEASTTLIYALGRLKDPKAINGIYEALKLGLENKKIKLAVLQAFKDINDSKIVTPTIILLNDPNQEIRWQAIDVLEGIKSAKSMEALYPLLFDDKPDIRWKTVYALGEIGDVEAIGHISMLLADPDDTVRGITENVLKKLGVSDVKIKDWKIKSEQLTIEDVYQSKLAYKKAVIEREALKSKLENEADIKKQLESSLKEREMALKRKGELVESLYEKERQLKSKLKQLEIAENKSEEFKKKLADLSNKAGEISKNISKGKSEASTANAKKELDQILQTKKKLEREAKSLREKEMKLRKEAFALKSVTEKTRQEAEKNKQEIFALREREVELLSQVKELKKQLNQKMAPVLVVSKPKSGIKIENSSTILHVIAVDDKGINTINVSLNGSALNLENERGIKILKTSEEKDLKKIDISVRLPLQYGENKIVVTVTDIDGLSKKETLLLTREKARGNIWAAVIGINHYQNTRNLKYSVNDAKAFKKYLESYLDIPDRNIFFLIDQQATRNNIQSLLGTKLKRKVAKDDTVIIFYAGHGAVETDPSNPDGDGFEKYLLPYDANLDDLYMSAISMNDVKTIFQRLRSDRLIFIADTCYSGASGGRTILATKTRANLSDKFFDRISRGRGRVIISSCSANEISKEDDRLKHGVFSYYLLEGLKGKADNDSDGVITVSELFSFLSRKVPNATGQDQHPVRKGETEGELVIGRVK